MKDIRRLLALYRPYTAWVLAGVFLSWITVVANVGLMAVSGWFIASMAIAGLSGGYINYFTPGAIIRFFAITRTGGRYVERLVTHEATFRVLSELRRWFYEHLEPLAPAALQHYHSADLLSRIRADIDTLQNFYLRVLTPAVVAVLATITFVAVLALFDPLIAVVELVFLLLASVAVPWRIFTLARPAGERMVEQRAQMRESVIDGVHGLGELMVYGASAQQAALIHQQGGALLNEQAQMARLNGMAQGAVTLFANFAMLGALLIAIPQVQAGDMPPPHLAMLALFTVACFELAVPLPLAFQTLPETLAAARRIFTIVDSKPVVSEPEQALALSETPDIEFDSVEFTYDQSRGAALKGLTFSLHYGKKLAIVGPTGSGKSSVVNLLMRFWPVSGGSILVNGEAIDQYSSDAIRSRFAVVSQQAHLFNATIRQNLLLAKPDASEQQLEEVCRVAQIQDFIQSQPRGLDTYVGEAGLKLSGGQARRIAIARALLKNAPILVLDEPAEGLDPQLEKEVLDAVLEYYAERSVLLISHRRAGLSAMDEIITLDQGHLVESDQLGAYL